MSASGAVSSCTLLLGADQDLWGTRVMATSEEIVNSSRAGNTKKILCLNHYW